jgi:transglutaminase-like putative cysteine protease
MQAYLPGAGWIDFDPTNSIIGNRNLIRVAVAWAPDQVLPLWGTYESSPGAFLGMDVTVTVTEADGSW